MYLSRWLVAKKFAQYLTFNWSPPDIPFGEDVSESQAAEMEKICGLVSIGDQFVMLLAVDLIVAV